MTDDNVKYTYLSRKHEGHYDKIESNTIGTLDKSESAKSGIPYVYDKSKENKV